MPFKNPVSIVTGSLQAGDQNTVFVVIDSQGIRIYRNGVLVGSWAPVAGTDQFGNSFPQDLSVGTTGNTAVQIASFLGQAFNNGQFESAIVMNSDDTNQLIPAIIGVVDFDRGQADEQMSTVVTSPVSNKKSFAMVLAADKDNASAEGSASLGTITTDGTGITYVPILTVDDVAAIAQKFLSYSSSGTQTQIFTTVGSNNWVAPVGVTSVLAECWGGGGSGGSVINHGGGGGGGGEYAAQSVVVTAGNTYHPTIGAGSTTSADGGNTTFAGNAITVTANGGHSSNSATGASGGSGSTNTTHHNGGSGATTAFNGGAGGGGAGGTTANGSNGSPGQSSGAGGAGGAGGVQGGGAGGLGGVNNGAAGKNGAAPGGGGGGVGGGTSPAAGNGANGMVRLTWTPSTNFIINSLSNTTGTDNFGNSIGAGLRVVRPDGNLMFAADTTNFITAFYDGSGVEYARFSSALTLSLPTIRNKVTGNPLTFRDVGTGTAVDVRNGSPGMPFLYGESGRTAFTFTAQAAISLTVNLTNTQANATYVAVCTVAIGSNNDVLWNITAQTTTSFTLRLFTRGLGNISASGTLHWIVTPVLN